jgi:hypothetical protein
MSAEGWAAIAAFIALGFTLISFVAWGAYTAGQHSTDIKSLKERQADTEKEARTARQEAAQAHAEMSGLTATVGALKDTVMAGFAELKATLREQIGRPSRTKTPND